MKLDQATGVKLSERSMNNLEMARQRIRKNRALSEAQKLMAKAYRGVEYIDAHHGAVKTEKPSDLTYRGIHYNL
jgi:hypothetical protein